MSENRRIYLAKIGYDGPKIEVYELVTITPKFFKVNNLTRRSYACRFDRGNPAVVWSIEDAMACLKGLVEKRIAAYERQLAEAKQWLATVDQVQPAWNEGVSHE